MTDNTFHSTTGSDKYNRVDLIHIAPCNHSVR